MKKRLVDELQRRIATTLKPLSEPWEVLLMSTMAVTTARWSCSKCQQTDPHVVIVNLTRNWGHQAALAAGLSVATGDAVVLMDGDLQDPPEVILEMIELGNGAVKLSSPFELAGPKPASAVCCFHCSTNCWQCSPIILCRSTLAFSAYWTDEPPTPYAICRSPIGYLPGLRSWVGFRRGMVSYHRDDRAKANPSKRFSDC